MKIQFSSKTENKAGGVQIDFEGKEIEAAIYAYLAAHNIQIDGLPSITINGELCKSGQLCVDGYGRVFDNGIEYSGISTNS